MHGSLSDITVVDLVVDLYANRRNGILRLSQGEAKKSLYFKEGSVVFAHSNLKHERLGEILLRLGKITAEEFQAVSAKIGEGMRLGKALYEQGFLAQGEINSSVSYQIQQIVYSVFNWESGEYEFVDRSRPVYEDIMLETSTPQLIIDGVRNISSLAVLERGIQGLENQVLNLATGPKRIPRSNLDFSEETLLACLDGRSTASQLRAMSRLSPHEFGRALYSLMVSGMLRASGPGGPARAAAGKDQASVPLFTQPMPPSEAPPEKPRGMKTYTELELRTLIAQTEMKFRDATDEEVLNVFPDALPEEIQRAYDRYTEIFHPPYYSTDRYRDVKDPLKSIIDRFDEAYHNLLDKASVQQPFLQEDPGEALSVDTTEQPPGDVMAEMGVKREEPAREFDSVHTMSVEQLEEALRGEPANTAAMRELGRKLQHAGKARDGEKHLLRALEIEPHSVENHFALADFYQAQGLKFKAFRHLNLILQIDPQNQRAMDALGIKKRRGGLYEITH